MPNILDIQAAIEFSPVNRPAISTGSLRTSFETTDKRYITGIQEIGDTESLLDIGDVDAVGLVVLMNRSNSINISVGLTGSFPIVLLPGQFCIFPPGAGDLYAIAASDTADLEFYVFPAKATES